jgi:hypothetical protein
MIIEIKQKYGTNFTDNNPTSSSCVIYKYLLIIIRFPLIFSLIHNIYLYLGMRDYDF